MSRLFKLAVILSILPCLAIGQDKDASVLHNTKGIFILGIENRRDQIDRESQNRYESLISIIPETIPRETQPPESIIERSWSNILWISNKLLMEGIEWVIAILLQAILGTIFFKREFDLRSLKNVAKVFVLLGPLILAYYYDDFTSDHKPIDEEVEVQTPSLAKPFIQ